MQTKASILTPQRKTNTWERQRDKMVLNREKEANIQEKGGTIEKCEDKLRQTKFLALELKEMWDERCGRRKSRKQWELVSSTSCRQFSLSFLLHFTLYWYSAYGPAHSSLTSPFTNHNETSWVSGCLASWSLYMILFRQGTASTKYDLSCG